MSQLKQIELAIQNKTLSFDGINQLPSTHKELVLAFCFKHDNLELFEKTLLSISFNETSIKNRKNILNWLISHNLNNDKDFDLILNKKTIQYCLHEGSKFDLTVISKHMKNFDLYKIFPYCDNLSHNDFNSIFVTPIMRKEFNLLNKSIYDTLDYHKKYNKEIPLKFFENLCKVIIPNCIIALEKNPKNKDLEECQFAIQEFIEYFSDKFDFFDSIPKNIFLSMNTTFFPQINQLSCEQYYNSMRENILNKKLQSNDRVIKKSKKI